jgi:hypothetical protein
MFRTRIELKQIGVRDEARRLGGIGRCGREYCSASWLPELRPVNLGVAKDQRLSLNPSQISGACGRLMCCLRYEHDFYVQQRKKFPKEGKTVSTTRGEEKVVSNDIFRERVTLRNSEGEFRVVALADLKREMDGRPAYPVHDEETPPIPVEGLTDEIIRLQDTSELPAWTPGGKRPVRRLPVVVEIAPEDVEEELQPAVVESAPETLVEQASPAAEAPPSPSESDENDADEDDESAEDGEPEGANAAGGDEARRPRGRRRRGRRGGRGGRRGRQGGDASGGSPPDGAADGGPDAGGGA